MSKNQNPLLYPAVVLDNEDPLMLGRIRARVLTDNYNDIIGGITNPVWNEQKDIWTARDPFLFTPLLPYFVYQVPKVEELVYGLYYNSDYKFQNQFYIQSNFSSPTLTPFEYYVGGQKFTGVGGQYKNPVPLKNQDGTYASKVNEGVFPEPGDNAILGRGSADLIVKENEVLLRAGKVIGNIIPNTIPAANNTRAFLQLSKFDNIKILDDVKTFNYKDEQVVLVKYLIEWVITNPENLQDSFTGSVYLYKLKPNVKTNSVELKVDSDVEVYKSLITSSDFVGLSMKNTVIFINDFINKCNNEDSINGKKVFNQTPFPIFYRPSNFTYKQMNTNPSATGPLPTISYNLSQIFNQIKLNNSTTTKGYGLIYTKNTVGFPYNVKSVETPIFKYTNDPVTFGGMGADKLVLLSHQSSIPGKGKINFDGTLYGISNDVYTDEIIPKTSSLVRGEELLDLLNVIVRFLITHTHAFPGLPPVPVTQDGSNTADLLSQMQNAINTILNQNIRLN
jgi:hypothetical protein